MSLRRSACICSLQVKLPCEEKERFKVREPWTGPSKEGYIQLISDLMHVLHRSCKPSKSEAVPPYHQMPRKQCERIARPVSPVMLIKIDDTWDEIDKRGAECNRGKQKDDEEQIRDLTPSMHGRQPYQRPASASCRSTRRPASSMVREVLFLCFQRGSSRSLTSSCTTLTTLLHFHLPRPLIEYQHEHAE